MKRHRRLSAAHRLAHSFLVDRALGLYNLPHLARGAAGEERISSFIGNPLTTIYLRLYFPHLRFYHLNKRKKIKRKDEKKQNAHGGDHLRHKLHFTDPPNWFHFAKNSSELRAVLRGCKNLFTSTGSLRVRSTDRDWNLECIYIYIYIYVSVFITMSDEWENKTKKKLNKRRGECKKKMNLSGYKLSIYIKVILRTWDWHPAEGARQMAPHTQSKNACMRDEERR